MIHLINAPTSTRTVSLIKDALTTHKLQNLVAEVSVSYIHYREHINVLLSYFSWIPGSQVPRFPGSQGTTCLLNVN